MKKSLILALALVFVMAGTAFAGPFADVPAKHWSYDAVSKLAQAGIIDGYGDGTFRGDKTMTRYEMAQIVGKAMEKSDKADAEQKALINKLADEFAKELDSLGVRVASLEKKIGNITWSGQVRSMYEWVEDSDSLRNTRLLLFLNAPLADNLSFKGRLWAETAWGTSNDNTTGSDVSMDQAYLAYSKGNLSWTLGRQGFMLGEGLVFAFFPGNDGATVTFGSDKTKLTLAALKTNWIVGNSNLFAANVAHKASKDLDLSLVYAKNKSSDAGVPGLGAAGEVFDTWALGGVYRGIDNMTLTAEYGINSSENANLMNAGDDAKAWVAQLKYKGADWGKEHSWGTWVGYRNAEAGFNGRNGDYIWEVPLAKSFYNMDNVKGFDVGIDYTVFKNGILTLQYFALEDENTGLNDEKGFIGQIRYMF
jgi:hypothetical protein